MKRALLGPFEKYFDSFTLGIVWIAHREKKVGNEIFKVKGDLIL